MAKDKAKKVRGSWWYGWVRYTYTDYNGTERDGRRATDWDFATKGEAHREAEKLAGGLASPAPQPKFHGQAIGPKTKKRPSRFVIVEVGASRVE